MSQSASDKTKPYGNKNHGNGKPNYQQRKWTGKCKELGENVYTVGEARSADLFPKTTEAIAEHLRIEMGQTMYDTITELKEVTFTIPVMEMAGEAPTEVEKMILSERVKQYVKDTKQYKEHLNSAYGYVWGQCTEGLKNQLQSRKDWTEIKTNHHPVTLLKAIREITQNYQDSKYPMKSIVDSLVNLLTIAQGQHGKAETLTSYEKRFKIVKDINEARFGKLSLGQYLVHTINYPENATADEKREIREKAREKAYDELLAYLFLKGGDANKSGALLNELSNDYAKGHDSGSSKKHDD